MDLKTKYSVGDTVFFMRNNAVQERVIATVRVDVTGSNEEKKIGKVDRTTVSYGVYTGYNPDAVQYAESELYASKEALLKTL